MYLFMPMGYVGYFILGFYLYNNEIAERHRNFLIIAAMLGVSYAIIGRILYGRYKEEPSQVTYNNLNINMVCYSAMVFIIFKDKIGAIVFSKKVKNVIYALSDTTLGIYLINIALVKIISNRFMVITDYKYPLVASICFTVFIFICCHLAVKIIKKIPIIGNRIV